MKAGVKTLILLLCSGWSIGVYGAQGELQGLLKELQSAASGPFSAAAGETLWYADYAGRNCTSCHGESVFTPGRHQRTGRVIAPMAPSINAERLQDAKKINKWLRRNCKWTLGRECTAQEKGDVLTWLAHQ